MKKIVKFILLCFFYPISVLVFLIALIISVPFWMFISNNLLNAVGRNIKNLDYWIKSL